MAAEPPAMSTCRVCHLPIRRTDWGWGHDKPQRVGMTHPRHEAKPERVKA